MFLRLLGVAAGGGYPQWNCACAMCQRARRRPQRPPRRFHASLAVSAAGNHWTIINATPDVHHQIEACAELRPGPRIRQSPLRQILLTDAELDHTLGLLVLREGTPLDVFATRSVLAALASSFPAQSILKRYASIRWREIEPGKTISLEGGRLRAIPFRLGSKRPRYAVGKHAGGDWVTGYRLEDAKTGGVAVYAPAIETWTAEFDQALRGADCLFLDGTFWSEKDLRRAGAGTLTARNMGHLPIDTPFGTLRRLAKLPVKYKVYVHVNNTNPILAARSPQMRRLERAGASVGWDGWQCEV